MQKADYHEEVTHHHYHDQKREISGKAMCEGDMSFSEMIKQCDQVGRQ